jgi:alpha-glucosidase
MQMARASFEGALRHQPDRRPFIITRAAYAGTQRYAMVWTGDNASSWEQLGDSVQMLLNLGLSGFPFCGSDAGGFLDNCTPELYVRWMQLAAFTPFFRNHSMTGTLAHEPWGFGPATEARVRSAIELRYQLLPYWYCLFAEAHRTGTPSMRPLVWSYQHDPVAAACGDQFLLGPFLMVAPVLRQGAVARSVYLPEGVWFDFWTGRRQVGPGHRVAEAPLDRLPLYVRGGAILPMADLRQHTSGPPEGRINLHLWPGGTGELDWYEDDGTTPRYADGAFHLRTLRWTGTTLSVGSVQGEFASRVRDWRLVVHGFQRRPTFDPACSEVRFDPATGLSTCRLANRATPFRVSVAKG